MLAMKSQPPVVVRDFFSWLSVVRGLKSTDVIVLFTPVMIPINYFKKDTDPFECFGKALQAHHPKIRHVPYTTRNGITSTHVAFVKRATVVMFVMTEALTSEHRPQLHAALVTRKALRDDRPFLTILTCVSENLEKFFEDFPTIIQSQDYMQSTLDRIASVMFGSQSLSPRSWQVEQWNGEIDSVYKLWTESTDMRFKLHVTTLAALLSRPGYAMHYVVKDSKGQLLGFCVTYFLYVDQGMDLIASLILLVDLNHRHQGIGLSLYRHAVDQLKKEPRVTKLQLGSTYPRILYGPPLCMEFDCNWFLRRGWRVGISGYDRIAYDMLLDFARWDYTVPESGATFRDCTQKDMERVLEVVEEEVAYNHKIGWFDQYSRLLDNVCVEDVELAIEDGTIVGVALTYMPLYCSPISADLPWAGHIGDDVGGVTCICIQPARRDDILVPLLNACIQKLQKHDMKRLFLDAVTENVKFFESLGFIKWVGYRDIWKDI